MAILKQPIIGISGSNSDSASVRAMMTQIASAGGVPMFLGNHTQRNADEDFAKIDAIVILGNNRDIDPSEYGQHTNQHPKTKSELLMPDGKTPDMNGVMRRNYEFRMIDLALKHGKPLLGVCGGMQRINVACHGRLHQHVPDLVGHEEHAQEQFGIAPFIPVQAITMADNTLLSSIAGDTGSVFAPAHTPMPEGMVLENSMHHQAVSVVGAGLRPSAFSNDKVKLSDGRDSLLIEAIEADPAGKYGKQFLLGVQWHPEFSASPLGAKIAARFTGAAQAYALEHPIEREMNNVQYENIRSALPQVQPPKVKPGGIVEMILKERAQAAGERQNGIAL